MPQLRGLRASLPKAVIEPPWRWTANAAISTSGSYAQKATFAKSSREGGMPHELLYRVIERLLSMRCRNLSQVTFTVRVKKDSLKLQPYPYAII